MSLKQEIETWVAALAHYDNRDFDDAIAEFGKISDTSKMLFNMGITYATMGEHQRAIECYQRAIRLDQYFAVAYFQQGVSNFLLEDYEEALANFNDTLLYLRGNSTIDYEQLGLLFKLYSCEVLFNRGMCYINLYQTEAGMQDLTFASKEKVLQSHNVIDEAMWDGAQGYTVFSVPEGVVYRPNEAKVRNLKTKDYLGKARLVAAASDQGNTFTGFAGLETKGSRPDLREERPPQAITFTASPLVKPGLQSRRQHVSDPPAARQVFPPTPPPEAERLTRGASVKNPAPRPVLAKLNIHSPEGSGPGRKYEKAYSPPDYRSDKTISPQDLNSSTSASSNGHSISNSIGAGAGAPRLEAAFSPQQQSRLRTQRSAATLGLSRGPSQHQQAPKDTAWRPTPAPGPGSIRPIEESQLQSLEREIEGLRLGNGGGSQRQGRPRQQQQQQQQQQQRYDFDANPNPSHLPADHDYYPDDLADNQNQNHNHDDEDDDDAASLYDDFEPRRLHTHSQSQSQSHSNSHSRSSSRVPRSGSRRPVEMRQVRVKVHAAAEVRYIMLSASATFADFSARIRDKMGLARREFKIKMRDEDEPADMITMGDQDDLDMAIESARNAARRERLDTGRLEVWVFEV